MEREFPVIFFDGGHFPEDSPADWVSAGDLQALEVFDASSRLVPNLKYAKAYLRRRLRKEAGGVSPTVSSNRKFADKIPSAGVAKLLTER